MVLFLLSRLLLFVCLFHFSSAKPSLSHWVEPQVELVTKQQVSQSLQDALEFFTHAQSVDGSFFYEYDFSDKLFKSSPHDETRLAGGIWAFLFLHHQNPSTQSKQTLSKLLPYIQSIITKLPSQENIQIVNFHNSEWLPFGAFSLLGLGVCELVSIDEQRSEEWKFVLEGLSNFLVSKCQENSLLPELFSRDGKQTKKEPSPFYNAEAALFLAQAGTILHKTQPLQASLQLLQQIMHKINKGNHMWINTNFHFVEQTVLTLATQNQLQISQMDQIIRWALKMAENKLTHHPPTQPLYALGWMFEGMVCSWKLAQIANDQTRVAQFQKYIHAGLSRLLLLQIASGLEPIGIMQQFKHELELFRGGVLVDNTKTIIRIDYTQHQAHAFLLALQLDFPF